MIELARILPGSWLDMQSDEWWHFYEDATFIHEWHVDADPHDGTYQIEGHTLRLQIGGWEPLVWQIANLTETVLTIQSAAGLWTLQKVG